MNTAIEIERQLSSDAQKCVEAIKVNSGNITNLGLIRLLGLQNETAIHNGKWSKIYQELSAIANRSEIIDYEDEPNRNHKGKILRKSSSNVWSYDPVL